VNRSSASLVPDLRRLGVPGAVASVLIAAAVIVVMISASGLVAAIATPGAGAEVAAATREREAGEYSRALDTHRARFDGRSLLFIPGPPPPPPPPPTVVVENDQPPPPPPPPSSYGGPKLIGMVNGAAWFEDGLKLGPGESKGDVRVVRLDPPWDAEIEWKGIPFTVSLFARDSLIERRTAPAPANPAEEPEAPAHDEKPGATPPSPPEEAPPPPPR
jgi:hypothetical protein